MIVTAKASLPVSEHKYGSIKGVEYIDPALVRSDNSYRQKPLSRWQVVLEFEPNSHSQGEIISVPSQEMVPNSSSVISDHTAEYVLVPKLVSMFGSEYKSVVPLYVWLRREGGKLSRNVHAADEFRSFTLFPRRPKSRPNDDTKLAMTIPEKMRAVQRLNRVANSISEFVLLFRGAKTHLGFEDNCQSDLTAGDPTTEGMPFS